jgi:hypothetical protein
VPGKVGVIVNEISSSFRTLCGRLGEIDRPEAIVPEIL